ncbi:PLC-like phosphodiesterase [Xylariomycetidae sp. FL0641]|nr:PLC-like phosphodiesterase [Xylariomycetidae sp. FL0641]
MRTSTTSSLAVLAAAGSGALARDCNGHAELCGRPYSNVSFVGAHNSAFVGVLPTQNQLTSVADQLDDGIRFLEVQTHDKDGTVELCHTSCAEEDAGSLEDFLATVKSFVDGHADDVVTLLITNGDDIDINKFGDLFASTGLDQYVFTPDSQLALADWPTLEDMLSSNQRVVVWMDYNMDTAQVPYILPEFDYYFETPFDPVADQLSGCDVDRSNGADAGSLMILANHNLNNEILGILIPDVTAADDTNSVDSISDQADTCVGLYGRNPNVVLLDYVVLGDVFAAQNALNGL